MKKTNQKPKPYDTALSLIKKEIQEIKTNRSNDLIYLYKDGYWEYRDSIPILKARIQKIAGPPVTKNFVEETIECIKRLTYIPASELEKNNRYICLKNCLYDLENEKTLNYNPEIFVTTRIPVNYNHNRSTDVIKKYIETLIEPNDIMKLQEHIGDILSPHTASKKLLYIHGNRNSGKSTFLNIIETVIGERNYCSLTLQQLNEKFTNFGIYERIANICSEMPYRITLKNLEHIKSLTGGDYITLEKKYIQPFKYRPILKHIFAANGIPNIDMKLADDAFFDRFDLIKFPNSYNPSSSITSQYTTDEMKSAWLNWMLEGYHRLKNNGWKFTNELDVETVEQLFTENKTKWNPFDTWLTEFYVASISPNDFKSKQHLHKDYLRYCKEHSVASRYLYPYPYFCKKMLEQNIILVTSARRGPKGKQTSVFVGIKKLE